MKELTENEEVFEAYAKIGYCYYSIQRIQDQLEKHHSPVEMLVDKATGYNRVTKMKKDLVELLKEVIVNKKIVDADYARDEEMLKDILKLIK